MAIRIDIEWEFISPLLQRASGVVKVWEVDQNLTVNIPNKLILQCNCHIESGAFGFKGKVPIDLFKIYEDRIASLMRSYYDGMVLRNKQHHWIAESLHSRECFEEWLNLRNKINQYAEGAKSLDTEDCFEKWYKNPKR